MGKRNAVDLFTPCDDPILRQLTADAFEPYSLGDLPDAAAAWQKVAAAYPADMVAQVFLARVTVWEAQGVPEGWDGVTALEGK
jgi:hypothetical protein